MIYIALNRIISIMLQKNNILFRLILSILEFCDRTARN